MRPSSSRSPLRLSPSAEPFNLTKVRLACQPPVESFRILFFAAVATSLPMSVEPETVGDERALKEIRGKKICYPQIRQQTFRLTWPGHARSNQYTRPSRRCQSRVRAVTAARPRCVPTARLSRRSRFTTIRNRRRRVNSDQMTRSTNARRPTWIVSSPGFDGCQCFSLNTSPLMRTPPC